MTSDDNLTARVKQMEERMDGLESAVREVGNQLTSIQK